MRIVSLVLAAFAVMMFIGTAEAQGSIDIECAGVDDEACQALAQNYLSGSDGVAQDDTKALALFAALCDRGLSWSCYKTASIYENGWGTPRTVESFRKALSFHERACLGDVTRACAAAATMYSGATLRNPERAQQLAQKACLDGEVRGCVLIDLDIMPMSDGDKAAIFDYFQSQCDAGDMDACFDLAKIHKASAFGYEFETARSLFEQACYGGHADACGAGAYAYANLDRFKAEEMQARGCSLGKRALCSPVDKTFVDSHENCVNKNVNIETACASWGRYLWDGDGVPQDKAEGMAQFRRSCQAAGDDVDSIEAVFACNMVQKSGDKYP